MDKAVSWYRSVYIDMPLSVLHIIYESIQLSVWGYRGMSGGLQHLEEVAVTLGLTSPGNMPRPTSVASTVNHSILGKNNMFPYIKSVDVRIIAGTT